MKKEALILFALIIASSMASSYDPTKNMDVVWQYALPSPGRSFTLGNFNNDANLEVIAGLYDDTILVINKDGRLNYSFSLGNSSKIGKIYALATDDLNGDGKDELFAGLGGLRIVENFPLHGFEPGTEESGGLVLKDKVLYQTVRNVGAVYYTDEKGALIWKKPMYNSVLSLGTDDVDLNGLKEILVGVGDYGVDVYSEATTLNYTNETCTEEYIVDEYIGYDQEKCDDQTACVDEHEIYSSPCHSTWNATAGECYIDYVKRTCTIIVTTAPGRKLVEYPMQNGTAYLQDRNGNIIWSKDMMNYRSTSPSLVNLSYDYNVRVVYSSNIYFDSKKEIFVGIDNGMLYVFNISGALANTYTPESQITGGITVVKVASFNETGEKYLIIGTNNGGLFFFNLKNTGPTWIARQKKSIEAIDVYDVDSDGAQEIVAGSEDGNIYIYDKSGINKWYYPTSSPIYYLKCLDIDRNGYADIVVGSLNNVTLYQMNMQYVLRQSAGFIYDKAQDYFSIADYTTAMIYATKAKEIYFQISDAEGITRCDVLIKRINDEFKSRKKLQADSDYDQAVAAYARNNINSSLNYIASARRIYAEINDLTGVSKCDSLKAEIEKFMISEKSITADFHYSKALNHFSFRNYTGSLEEARAAKAIYTEIGYYNGTLATNRLITSIADSYYANSQFYLSQRSFNLSMDNALIAMELYNETRTYDGTAKTDLLMQDIRKKMTEAPPVKPQETDYTTMLYILIGGMLVVIAILQIRRRKLTSLPEKAAGSEDYGEPKM